MAQIVGALLEADAENFSARDYFLDPDAETDEVLQALKTGLASYYQSVEIYPAIEGLANFPKFFEQGNRYRIRCKRGGPPLRLHDKARQQKADVERFIMDTVNKFGYYAHALEYYGNVFSNLLIILDMWPLESSFKKKVALQ